MKPSIEPCETGAPPESQETNAPARLNIRPAKPEDVQPLQFFFDTALRRDYFMRRGQLAELVVSRRHKVLLAELDNVLVGVAITTRCNRLVNALIHPAYRGLGIGRAIVNRTKAAEVRAKLDMSTGDPRPFYQRLGYVSTGVRNAKGNIELMRREKSNKVTKSQGNKETK